MDGLGSDPSRASKIAQARDLGPQKRKGEGVGSARGTRAQGAVLGELATHPDFDADEPEPSFGPDVIPAADRTATRL